MKQRWFFIKIVAAFAMMLAHQSLSAAQIELQIRLLDTDDVELWSFIYPGEIFKVGVFARVINPNFTDTLRTGTTMDNKPLGISELKVNLVATALAITPPGGAPMLDPADVSPPLSWHPDFITTRLQDPLVPTTPVGAIDLNADGVLDINDAGFANLSRTLSSTAALPSFQAGVTTDDYQLVVAGAYQVNYVQFTRIDLQVLSAGVFVDPAGGSGVALQSEDVLATVTIGPSIFYNMPEPASAGVVGLGLLGLLGMRRRT